MIRGRAPLVVALAAGFVLSGCVGASSSPSPSGPSVAPSAASARPTASATPTRSGAPTATPTETPTPTSTPTSMPTSTPGATPTVAPTPSPTPAFVAHTVVAGETLGTIASRYGTTWQSLLYWNRATYPSLDPDDPTYDPDVIRVGWLLRLIPGTSVPFDAPLPTAAPTPAPTTPPVGAASTLVGSGSRATNRVALTFDMGGRVEPAIPIMTWLRDHGIPATIFMTGSMADSTATDAGRQVLAMVDARPDLFDLGNHSYAHPDMTTMSAAAIIDEIAGAEAAIGRYAAQSPRPFFRPPYGAVNSSVLSAVGAAGYPYTVMWDIDTIDWKPIADGGPTAEQIVDKVLSRAQGGSIVLMHLGGYETLAALPGIVAGLEARGFGLVTLGTMFGT